MRSNALEVIGAVEHGQKDSVGDKVKPREGASLLIQVYDEGFETDLQLFVNMLQYNALWHLTAMATLEK